MMAAFSSHRRYLEKGKDGNEMRQIAAQLCREHCDRGVEALCYRKRTAWIGAIIVRYAVGRYGQY